jgi:hypothetical protein
VYFLKRTTSITLVPDLHYETVNNYYEAVKLMKARTTSIVSILAVLLTFASLTISLGSTAFAQGNQSQQQQQNQTGGAQTPALGNASQLSQVLGNNTSVLSENTPIGNENVSTTEKMNREQTSLDNKTEAKNMTMQQGAGTTANQSQQNQTSQQQGQNTSQSASSSSNATNQSQQQGQNNNTNPLSNIPVLGKLFGGK